MVDATVAVDALNLLYGDKPEGTYLTLWRRDEKRTYWVDEIEEAREIISTVATRTDLYMGVGLAKQIKYSPRFAADARRNGQDPEASRKTDQRPGAQDVTGIVGLWLDMDIAGDAHAKENLPPDTEAALSLLSEIPLEPTIVLHSGHGLQAWWALNEPWMFESETEADEARNLTFRWNATWRSVAHRHGWTVDSVFDLSRIMRLPGSENHKNPQAVLPVQVLSQSEARYEPDDFEAYLVDLSQAPLAALNLPSGDFALDCNAQPPLAKLEALKMLEPGFKAAVEYSKVGRTDMSPSSYDMTLANYAAKAGWSEQEIVDLLIWVRRCHHVDLKLRHDYYSRTLAKAKASVRIESSEDYLEDLDAAKVESCGEATPPTAELKAHMGTLMGFEIRRMVKILTDPPDYAVETNLGNIHLGKVENLMSWEFFRRRVADTTKHLIPRMENKQWDRIVAGLLMVSEDESVGEEATTSGWMRVTMRDYLDEIHVTRDRDEGMETRTAWREGPDAYIYLMDLRDWLSKRRRETLSPKELSLRLKSMGAEAKKLYYISKDDKRTSVNVYLVKGV